MCIARMVPRYPYRKMLKFHIFHVRDLHYISFSRWGVYLDCLFLDWVVLLLFLIEYLLCLSFIYYNTILDKANVLSQNQPVTM